MKDDKVKPVSIEMHIQTHKHEQNTSLAWVVNTIFLQKIPIIYNVLVLVLV